MPRQMLSNFLSLCSLNPRPPVPPSDLLFLVALTSSVCVVSEAIKKVERWRGAERSPPTDCFHEV